MNTKKGNITMNDLAEMIKQGFNMIYKFKFVDLKKRIEILEKKSMLYF